MIKADSRAYGIEGKTSVYATSAPINSKWGQPSASYYFFTIAGNKMRGQPIAGVYVVSSSVDILAPGPGLSSLDIPDITFEEASNSEWLELSTSTFDFWNNDLDSAYDNL